MAELEITGSADGITAATGEMNIGLLLSGVADGAAAVSGAMNIGLVAAGSAGGVTVATGYFMIKFGASGAAAAVSSAAGGMNVALVAAGTAGGVSTVSGNVEEGLQVTLDYPGTQELGAGSPQGSKFDIEITGEFSTLSITMNGKTVTFTDDVNGETIRIDNVNMEVFKDGDNALEYLSGDIYSFLKLVPGNNTIVIEKTGGECAVTFDFRPMWL